MINYHGQSIQKKGGPRRGRINYSTVGSPQGVIKRAGSLDKVTLISVLVFGKSKQIIKLPGKHIDTGTCIGTVVTVLTVRPDSEQKSGIP